MPPCVTLFICAGDNERSSRIVCLCHSSGSFQNSPRPPASLQPSGLHAVLVSNKPPRHSCHRNLFELPSPSLELSEAEL